MSPPVKRNKYALADSRDRAGTVSHGLGKDGARKSILGEQKAMLNIDTLAMKGSKLSECKKVGYLKHSELKKSGHLKRPLASPSLQRMARTSNRNRSGSKPILHQAVERARGIYLSSPLRNSSSSGDESDGGVPLTAETVACAPESWDFDIYEDSHAETLQNLMEHSTTVLDISDDSEDEKWGSDEISIKGKENISPERMAEIIVGAASMMEVDAKESKASGQKREALGELDVEEFYPKEKEVEKVGRKVMTLKDASEVVLKFNNAPSLGFPRARECKDSKLWASEGETDEESDEDAGVPLTPPKGIEKQFKIIYEDDEPAIEIECGSSDKEN